MENFGILTLLPTACVITCALITHRPILSLLLGVVVGLFMIDPSSIVVNLATVAKSQMMLYEIAWVILVCGLFGSLIYILIRTGAALGFARSMIRLADTRNKSLIATWFLGILLFIDDYLNAIAIGASVKKVTDKYKVSRGMLSYIVDSTAAPTCVLVPISTWAVFFAGVLESEDLVPNGQGLAAYISGIPYMFYPIVALLLVPLVATGRFPLLGLMKKAEAKAAQGIMALEPTPSIGDDAEPSADEATGVWDFLVPMLILIGASVYFISDNNPDTDVLEGAIVALIVTIPYMVFKRLISFHASLDAVLEGFRVMLPPLAIVVVAFMFKEVNDQIGLPTYVIESVTPYMTPLMFPVIAFLTMAMVSFATGSSWGIFAIAIPIMVPLGLAVGVDLPIIIGAMLSASSFGSHACFYSDATVLSAQSCGLSVMEHALTQLPYAVIAALLACALFIAVSL